VRAGVEAERAVDLFGSRGEESHAVN
jgi:hypothetical protein